jgi:hypothetical protein
MSNLQLPRANFQDLHSLAICFQQTGLLVLSAEFFGIAEPLRLLGQKAWVVICR